MSYKCYLFGELMPQTPAKLSVKISGKNTTVTLLNEGEINFLKYPGLTEITLPLVFPMLTASKRPDYYLALLERAKTKRGTTQFVMTRTTPAGKLLFDTNIKVSIEDYTFNEDASNGLDVSVDVKLKQYRDYGTKMVEIDENNKVVSIVRERDANTAPLMTFYTVKKDDTLWSIASSVYGKGENWQTLYNANKDVIEDPNVIQSGQLLVVPR